MRAACGIFLSKHTNWNSVTDEKRRGAVRRKAEAKVTGCGSVRTDKEQSARSWLYVQHCAATWDEDSTSLESEAWFQNDKKGGENGNSAFSEQGKNTNFKSVPALPLSMRPSCFLFFQVFPTFPTSYSHFSNVIPTFLLCFLCVLLFYFVFLFSPNLFLFFSFFHFANLFLFLSYFLHTLKPYVFLIYLLFWKQHKRSSAISRDATSTASFAQCGK